MLLDRAVEQDDLSANLVRKALKELGRYKLADVSLEKKKDDGATQEVQKCLAHRVLSADKVKALAVDPLWLVTKGPDDTR